MRLIHAVEVNYFRSIYACHLRKMSDLNVFVGGNDVGKSNLLRALNLFFNNEPSALEPFDFLEDVSHGRQQAARETKSRLTIWVKITFNNIEKWDSLPERFSVKRSWNRYSTTPDTTYDKSISNSANVTRFLNKIAFHHVPAIKPPDLYGFYLRKLYDTISQEKGSDFSDPAQRLSAEINAAVEDMSAKIEDAIGVKSSIDIPSNFSDLFEKLRFQTYSSGFGIPLTRRGDGIQSRHIPHILEFISEHNKKHNIWAYEEPENSLEMKNSFELAGQFEDAFSVRNQIFVTTHSPAFYSLSGDSAKVYVASKETGEGEPVKTTFVPLDNPSIADEQLGIASLIAQKSKELYEQISSLQESIEKAADLTKSVIITEGKSDCVVYEEGLKRIGTSDEFTVMSIEEEEGVGGGHSKLQSFLSSIPHRERHIRIGVFDRDSPGINSFEKLKGFKTWKSDLDVKIRHCGKVFAVILPDLDWDHEYFHLAGKPVFLEMLLPASIYSNEEIKVFFDSASGSINQKEAKEIISKVGDDAHKVIRASISFTNKTKLSEKIIMLPDDKLDKVIEFCRKISEIRATSINADEQTVS